MKLMINGAVTCGTMDGANVEIFESVGEDNIFIFGLTTPEVNDLYSRGYNPRLYYDNDKDIRDVLEFIKNGGVNGQNFDNIYNNLLNSDPFMCLADFKSYCNIHDKIDSIYSDEKTFYKMSLKNIANAGMFASDRSVTDYAKNIWHTEPVM